MHTIIELEYSKSCTVLFSVNTAKEFQLPGDSGTMVSAIGIWSEARGAQKDEKRMVGKYLPGYSYLLSKHVKIQQTLLKDDYIKLLKQA